MLPASPPVPLREALLLLPDLPRTAQVLSHDDGWQPALTAWGVEPAAASTDLAVGDDAAALAASGAAHVLLAGRDDQQRLATAGYQLSVWRATPTRLGSGALVRVDDSSLIRALRTGGARRRPAQIAADVVRWMRGPGVVIVGSRVPGPPLALRRTAAATTSAALLTGQASSRRRPVFLVWAGGLAPERVVKVGTGGDAADRSRLEQEVLGRLATLGVQGVPAGLGHGREGPLVWAAETALPGAPLLDVLTATGGTAALRRLEQVADLLVRLAAATRGARTDDPAMRLRGPHLAAAALVPADVPGVLVHGDAAANTLLSAESVSLLDWETARPGGLPLQDLVPVLCLGLLAARRIPERDGATYLLTALRGGSRDGPWLLGQVRHALHRLGLPVECAGRLTAVALASWASMRLVHDELVRADGGEAVSWSSPVDVLAPAWLEDPRLGAAWPALRDVSAP